MKLTIVKITFIVTCMCLACVAFGQNLTKNAVLNMKVTDTGVIYQNGIVKGYYYLYNLEQKDASTVTYLLSILDENLNEINSTQIIRPKNYSLMEASFNGSAFAFLFYDRSNHRIELTTYDSFLKNPKIHTTALTKSSTRKYYNQEALSNFSDQRFLLPVEGTGFVQYSIADDSGINFKIEYFTNDLTRVWEYESGVKNRSGVQEIASDAFQTPPYVGSIVARTEGQDMSYDLVVQEIATGKKVMRRTLSSGNFDVTPTAVRYDSATDQFRVVGEYYNKADKEMSSQSQGFCYMAISTLGEIKTFKRISWTDLSAKTVMSSNGKMGGSNAHILFHDFVRTSDGKVFAIGEEYKKAASGAGIALSILAAAGGGYSSTGMTQMNILNLVVVQFDSIFDMEKVHIFEKNKTVIPLATGSMYVSPKSLSQRIKALGGFDYRFTQNLKEEGSFAIVYTDFESQRAQGIIGSVVYTPEKTFVVDKMIFNRKTAAFALLRAKPGYILVAEYIRKEKKLDMRLEKINY